MNFDVWKLFEFQRNCSSYSVGYILLYDIQLMDCLHSQWCSYIEVNDLKHDNRHCVHKRLDMDQRICYSNMHDHFYNHHFVHIQAYNRCMDHRNNLVNIDMHQHHFVLYKLHLHRMDSGYRHDVLHLGLVELFEKFGFFFI